MQNSIRCIIFFKHHLSYTLVPHHKAAFENMNEPIQMESL